MNPAARLVIVILGVIAVLTVSTICAVAFRTGETAIVKDIALLTIGAISGVLAKVGYDAVHPASVGPVSGSTVTVNPTPEGASSEAPKAQS